jgi:Putative zinc-finger
MSAERGCDQIRALLPELALGIAEGEERGMALEHLADCPDCRRRLVELAEVADEILLLAPSEEPVAGFESRVLDQLRPRRARRRRTPLRLLIPATAAALAVAATMVFAYRDDRDLADRYRGTLAEANGKYLSAEKLTAPSGEDVGVAFGYEGSPSWVLVTVEEAEMAAGSYQVELVTTSGQRIPLRPLEIENGTGSRGQSIPVHFEKVAEVRLLGSARGDVYDARFHED